MSLQNNNIAPKQDMNSFQIAQKIWLVMLTFFFKVFIM